MHGRDAVLTEGRKSHPRSHNRWKGHALADMAGVSTLVHQHGHFRGGQCMGYLEFHKDAWAFHV